MPEAFTYYDMQRRIASAIPDQCNFNLRIYESSSRYKGIDEDVAKLTRKHKLKARQADPSKFKDNVSATFPGLENLPEEIKKGTIKLTGSDVRSRGKAIGIPIGGDWWISIQLLMHGHIVIISAKELDTLDSSITVQMALVNQDHAKPSIIIVDRIRLTILKFVHTPNSSWWSKKQGPCPITEPKAFAAKFDKLSLPKNSEQSIFKVLTKRQTFFNGIGTSHANEILHLAMEHPAQKAGIILQDKTRREALKNAIGRFFDFAHSDKYTSSVPAGRSGGSAFFEPHYLTKNIISMQQRVYGHTKSPTKISKAHYEELFQRGLLDPKYQALGTTKRGRASKDSANESKKVEVYAIRFIDKHKKGEEVSDGQYAYTVMCQTPPNCVAVRYETKEKALRQALGSRSAEIGIASFMDNAKIRRFEKKAFKRRFPVKTGKPGRPRKSKNAKFQASFGAIDPFAKDEEDISNKDLVISSSASTAPGDSASIVKATNEPDAASSEDCDSSVDDADEGLEGDGEDADRVLEEAIALDEVSSGTEDEEVFGDPADDDENSEGEHTER